MHYVKLKTVVSKVVDELIDDLETIKQIMQVIYSRQLDCAITLNSGPKLFPVRIEKMDENEFSFRIIRIHGSLQKSALYTDIQYLEVNSQDSVISRVKPDVTRWMLLDPAATI